MFGMGTGVTLSVELLSHFGSASASLGIVSKKTEAILKGALAMTDAECAEVAVVLPESLEPPPDVNVKQAWRE